VGKPGFVPLALLILLALLIAASVDTAGQPLPKAAVPPLPTIPHHELPSFSGPEPTKPPRYTERQIPNHSHQDVEYDPKSGLQQIYNKTIGDPIAIFTLILAISTIGLWIVTWRSGVRQSRDTRLLIAENRRAAEQQSLNMGASSHNWRSR
jgi:hypothetical protein